MAFDFSKADDVLSLNTFSWKFVTEIMLRLVPR